MLVDPIIVRLDTLKNTLFCHLPGHITFIINKPYLNSIEQAFGNNIIPNTIVAESISDNKVDFSSDG
jgi:hypothetical protein